MEKVAVLHANGSGPLFLFCGSRSRGNHARRKESPLVRYEFVGVHLGTMQQARHASSLPAKFCNFDCNDSSNRLLNVKLKNFHSNQRAVVSSNTLTKSSVERSSRLCGWLSPKAEIDDTRRERRYRTSNVDYQQNSMQENSNGPSIWDSNAENIRRSNSTGKRDTWDLPPRKRPVREWNYDSDGENASDDWQWWRIRWDDDAYESETEDVDNPISWMNFDVQNAFSILGWMFPLAVVLLPWLSGNGMLLMMAFAFFPLAKKAIGPFWGDIWKSLLKRPTSSPLKQKRKRSNPFSGQSNSRSARPAVEEERFSGVGSWRENGEGPDLPSTTTGPDDRLGNEVRSVKNRNQNMVDLLTYKPDERVRNLNMGGWNELEDDSQRVNKIIQGRKKEKVNRRVKRREVPLLLRFLIALFPFLRNWGGFL